MKLFSAHDQYGLFCPSLAVRPAQVARTDGRRGSACAPCALRPAPPRSGKGALVTLHRQAGPTPTPVEPSATCCRLTSRRAKPQPISTRHHPPAAAPSRSPPLLPSPKPNGRRPRRPVLPPPPFSLSRCSRPRIGAARRGDGLHPIACECGGPGAGPRAGRERERSPRRPLPVRHPHASGVPSLRSSVAAACLPIRDECSVVLQGQTRGHRPAGRVAGGLRRQRKGNRPPWLVFFFLLYTHASAC